MSAQVQKDKNDKELINKFNIHKCSKKLCLDDNDKCEKHFPKPFGHITRVDEDLAIVLYQRRTVEDQYVVPDNIKLSRKIQCNINVEVVFSIKFVGSL